MPHSRRVWSSAWNGVRRCSGRLGQATGRPHPQPRRRRPRVARRRASRSRGGAAAERAWVRQGRGSEDVGAPDGRRGARVGGDAAPPPAPPRLGADRPENGWPGGRGGGKWEELAEKGGQYKRKSTLQTPEREW